ncbi:hypothetical protein K7432_010848 [Basidiobolus ranarum]|uniref:Uncharacterized protein n=1 Tax=Basidiobolus ranarum TaxID=34480 RepID=A0ABR2VUV5_9FUNG
MDQLFDFMFMENVLGSCNRKLRKYNRSKKREQNLRTRLLLINFRKAAKRELATLNQDEDDEFVQVPIPSKQSTEMIMAVDQSKELSSQEQPHSTQVDYESLCQQPMSCENITPYLVSDSTEQSHHSDNSDMVKRCRETLWNDGESIQTGKRARLCF